MEAGLIGRARAGDAEALTEIFRRYGQQVYETAYHLTGSGDDADDIVQDIFVGLPEALRSFDAESSLGTWLGRIAARAALLRQRSEERRARRQEEAGDLGRLEYVPRPAVEAKLTLYRTLARMREDWRQVYVLFEIEGYGHDEIAGTLGISTAGSQVMLYRARKFLAERLRGKL